MVRASPAVSRLGRVGQCRKEKSLGTLVVRKRSAKLHTEYRFDKIQYNDDNDDTNNNIYHKAVAGKYVVGRMLGRRD